MEFNSVQAVYLQISHDIQSDIFRNYDIHDKIPSEAQLSKKYNVTRSTIQKALKELEESGVIYKVHGKGSFVKAKSPKINMFTFSGFSDYVRKMGGDAVTKVLSQEVLQQKGKKIFKLHRLRGVKINGAITWMTIDLSLLDLHHFPNLDKNDFATHSLYDTIRTNYDVYPCTANLSVHAFLSTEDENRIFNMENSQPLLMVEGIVLSDRGTLVEQVKIIYSNDANFKLVTGI
ncbi:GntR family transcriptional regulator [Sporolactobacillus sp. KGMB 08714]|uniref:GntR family transcriptional regulator n=1 Tax=Sporolactobacillus sp. KGMB 08714 TaxID=3064704 RepID=UPI002FBE284C